MGRRVVAICDRCGVDLEPHRLERARCVMFGALDDELCPEGSLDADTPYLCGDCVAWLRGEMFHGPGYQV